MTTVDDLFSQEHLRVSVEELKEVIEKDFDNLEVVVIVWQSDDKISHRAYGTTTEVVGLLARASYIVSRENTGETQDTEEGDGEIAER